VRDVDVLGLGVDLKTLVEESKGGGATPMARCARCSTLATT